MNDKKVMQQALGALGRVNAVDNDCDILSLSLSETVMESIEALRTAISQPVTDLERYIAANYPDARGETITARVIDALETMDIALGMREIAQPVPGAPA